MDIAVGTASTHIGVLILLALLLFGVVGMVTTHKGNKGRRTGGRARPKSRRRQGH